MQLGPAPAWSLADHASAAATAPRTTSRGPDRPRRAPVLPAAIDRERAAKPGYNDSLTAAMNVTTSDQTRDGWRLTTLRKR